mmetsp:Transcript_72444/g.120774  ORF Transcript_72444/g.120774 Transcript_72444/m.120774 type:complete len:83 (-) Transcript_72444:1087-1335(-)
MQRATPHPIAMPAISPSSSPSLLDDPRSWTDCRIGNSGRGDLRGGRGGGKGLGGGGGNNGGEGGLGGKDGLGGSSTKMTTSS